jgi:hypothetical protein
LKERLFGFVGCSFATPVALVGIPNMLEEGLAWIKQENFGCHGHNGQKALLDGGDESYWLLLLLMQFSISL